MDYKIEAKPFVHKSGQKYLTVEITDMAFHSSNPRETVKIGKKMEEAIAEKRAGRFYKPLTSPPPLDRASIRQYIIEQLQQNEDFVRLVKEHEEQGVKVLIAIPEDYIPVGLGADAVEFMNSKNGKRLLRGVAKEKREE